MEGERSSEGISQTVKLTGEPAPASGQERVDESPFSARCRYVGADCGAVDAVVAAVRHDLGQRHARRKFFELAHVEGAARKKSRGERASPIYPIALEAVQKLEALFDVERGINGKTPAERLAARQELSAPLMAELHDWLNAQLAKLSRNHDLAKAINYMLRRWDAFTRFLIDGRVCPTNNAAERALRCVPLGRKAWLFCGSDRSGQRAAIMFSFIQSCRLNDVDPQAWLADVLARIAGHPANRLGDLLPWNWKPIALKLES